MSAIARTTYLRAWTVLIAALAVLAAAAALSLDIFDRVDPFDIADPASEEVRAGDAIEAETGRSAAPGVVLLVEPTGDVTAATSALAGVDGIASVDGPETNPDLSSAEGGSLVLGYVDPGANRVDVGRAAERATAGLEGVLAGGTAVAAHQVGERSEDDSRRIELLAAPLLFILLLIVFRTLIAAILPLLVAGVSILVTFAALRLLTSATQIDLFSLQVVTGIGVGLAVDYSLFVIARYREEIQAGESYQTAHLRTLQTAGRTVVFSALTVAAALAALTVFPQPFLRSTGIAGALTAISAGLTAVLALPAALALIGPSIDRFAIRRDPFGNRRSNRGGLWRRLPAGACRLPVASILVGAALMLALGSQVLGAGLTTPDARELPAEASARLVAERTVEQFPEVSPTFLYAVVPTDGKGRRDANPVALARTLRKVPEVSAVLAPTGLGDGRLQLSITSDADPLSDAGQDLVDDIRDELPEGSLLGGRAAELTDQRASIADHAPEALVILLVTNLLLVAAMTRSLLLPLLAVGMNLLTVAGALGAMNALFTHEWTANLLGTDAQDAIDISVPVLAFAVAFGLSTDYGIFVLARIREARAAAGTEREAIVDGVSSSGRLISAAAVLLAVAVGAFVFSDLVFIKEFAVAVAIAVLLDATVVRGLLIPAFLRLLGRSAWWPGGARAGSGARAG